MQIVDDKKQFVLLNREDCRVTKPKESTIRFQIGKNLLSNKNLMDQVYVQKTDKLRIEHETAQILQEQSPEFVSYHRVILSEFARALPADKYYIEIKHNPDLGLLLYYAWLTKEEKAYIDLAIK